MFKRTRKKPEPTGIIIIRIPEGGAESQMVRWDIDAHAIPAILRGQADSFEREHCGEGGTMENHEHTEQ